MKTMKVAVNGKNTVILSMEKFTDGEEQFYVYHVDEPWNPEKESLRDFCRRNENCGFSDSFDREDGIREFESLAGDGELDRYTLVDYFDVWGNEEDGFEVNDVSRLEGFFLPKDATDEQIIGILRASGYFNEKASAETVLVDDAGDGMIEFTDKDTLRPICRFELDRTEEKPAKKAVPEECLVSVMVPFTWEMSGTARVDVPARPDSTAEELMEAAFEKAMSDPDSIPLPSEAKYVDGSFEAYVDDPEDLEDYNGNLDEKLKRIFQ